MEYVCAVCGVRFQAPPCRHAKYCSTACYSTVPKSVETLAKMSAASKGKAKTPEHRAAMSAGMRGKPKPWNRGAANPNWGNKAQGTPEGRKNFLAGMVLRPPQTAEMHRKHSETMKGPANAMRGKAHSEATRIAVSAKKQGVSVVDWTGFATPVGAMERASVRFEKWRKSVFERDNYTCAMCSKHGGSLHAHHIKTFAKYPDLRYEVSNGITLCGSPCHRSLRRKEEQHEARFIAIVASRGGAS